MFEDREDKSVAEANRLMEAGEHEEAKVILEGLIERNSPSEDLYENIIYNYLLGECYAKAKEVAQRYEHEFGAKPTPELSLEAIEEEERKQQIIENHHGSGGQAVFQRLSIGARGGLPRYLPWRSMVWQEVRVEPKAIVLVKRRRIYSLKWEDIRSASLKKERSFVGENRSYVKKLIILQTIRGETHKVDVSTTFPEFARPRALEQAVRNRLSLEEGDVEEWDESRGLLGGLLAFLIVLLIVALGIWATNAFM